MSIVNCKFIPLYLLFCHIYYIYYLLLTILYTTVYKIVDFLYGMCIMVLGLYYHSTLVI